MAPKDERVDQREDLLEQVVSWLAEQGPQHSTLDEIAAGLGVDEQVLLDHFGSREQLLGAIIPLMGRGERGFMDGMVEGMGDPFEGAWAMWDHTAWAQGGVFGPMYFEVAAQAMYNVDWAVPLRDEMRLQWVGHLADVMRSLGVEDAKAQRVAQLTMAVTRGLIFDLALGADRDECDAVMREYISRTRRDLGM